MKRSILVVEDEFWIALDLQGILESHGYEVMGPAPSVRHALKLINARLPSAALLDVNLGKEMVTPVAEALRDAGVPFAVTSAYHKPEQMGGAVLADAVLLRKPFSERQILATVERLLARDVA